MSGINGKDIKTGRKLILPEGASRHIKEAAPEPIAEQVRINIGYEPVQKVCAIGILPPRSPVYFTPNDFVSMATAMHRCAADNGATTSVGDGYHTMAELYDHRNHLFVALCLSNADRAWRSLKHADGMMSPDFFIAGLNLDPQGAGPITYHLPIDMWDLLEFDGITTLEQAPEWDGHTPADVLARLQASME